MADPSSDTKNSSTAEAAATSTAAPSSTPIAESQSEGSSSASRQVSPTACAQCGKSPDSVKECIKCHSVSYCNKECQKAHFKAHKKACPILAQEYVKLHEPKMASRASGAAKGGTRERGLQKWQVSVKCICKRNEKDGLTGWQFDT